MNDMEQLRLIADALFVRNGLVPSDQEVEGIFVEVLANRAVSPAGEENSSSVASLESDLSDLRTTVHDLAKETSDHVQESRSPPETDVTMHGPQYGDFPNVPGSR